MGCTKYLCSRFRKVQNDAPWLIFRTHRSNHVTPTLHFPHWLPSEKRIEYKLSLLCFSLRSDQAHIYLSKLIYLNSPSYFAQWVSNCVCRVGVCGGGGGRVCEWMCVRAHTKRLRPSWVSYTKSPLTLLLLMKQWDPPVTNTFKVKFCLKGTPSEDASWLKT